VIKKGWLMIERAAFLSSLFLYLGMSATRKQNSKNNMKRKPLMLANFGSMVSEISVIYRLNLRFNSSVGVSTIVYHQK
jgi:hypothetical protein